MEDKKLEALKVDSADEYIQAFDEEFGSMLKAEIKDTPFLVDIFREYLEQHCKTTKYYKRIMRRVVEIIDELITTFNDEQKEKFKKYEIYRDMLNDDTLMQCFLYGFCMDKQLRKEKGSDPKTIKATNVIETKDVNIGTKIILQDGRKATIQEFVEKIIPLHHIIIGFDTDIGYVGKDDIRDIYK